MAIYDEKELRGIVGSLRTTANLLVLGWALIGTILGGSIGAVLSVVSPRNSGDVGAFLVLPGGILGLVAGVVKGTSAAFGRRAQAEGLACLHQIEQNTRSPEDRKREADTKAQQTAKPQRLFRDAGKH